MSGFRDDGTFKPDKKNHPNRRVSPPYVMDDEEYMRVRRAEAADDVYYGRDPNEPEDDYDDDLGPSRHQ